VIEIGYSFTKHGINLEDLKDIIPKRLDFMKNMTNNEGVLKVQLKQIQKARSGTPLKPI
jgi:hypothetical protein